MLAYIDAGTAAAIAAMATGGLAGAKVAVQSVVFGRRRSKKVETAVDETEVAATEVEVEEHSADVPRAA